MPAAAPRPPTPPRPPRGGLRPWTRERRVERRLSRRLAAGLTPAQAARAEGVAEAEVETLLADADFAALVEDYRALEALPEVHARARLRRLARGLLEEAVAEGDARVALFIAREERRGRDPAATLADGVIAAARRVESSAPSSPAPGRPAVAPRHRDPVDRAAWRVAARLRAALLRGNAVVRRAAAPETPPSPPPSPILRTGEGAETRALTPALSLLTEGEGASTTALAPPRAPSPSQRERVGVRALPLSLPPPPVTPAMGEGRGEGVPPPQPAPPSPRLNRHQRRRRAALARRTRPPPRP